MGRSLVSLPHEVVHHVLNKIDAQDLASMRSVCVSLRDFIDSDGLLFKEIFLLNFDDPRGSPWYHKDADEPEWKQLLQNYTRAQRLLRSQDTAHKRDHLTWALKTITEALRTATGASDHSRTLGSFELYFGQDAQQNIDLYLCNSSLFDWAKSYVPLCGELRDRLPPSSGRESDSRQPQDPVSGPDFDTRQLSAKLHCLYGIPIQEVRRRSRRMSGSLYALRSHGGVIHPYARSKVYDLRQHTARSFWGPFLPDGSQKVDWEKIEAIMLILDFNMSQYWKTHEVDDHFIPPEKDRPFTGAVPHSYVSKKVPIPTAPPLPLLLQDPYNISGTWMRIVCFLDYTELFEFNFAGSHIEPWRPRPPTNSEEATRIITMKIEVTKIAPPGESEGQQLPIVHFEGISSSVRPSWDPNANSHIKGTVKLTPEGEVRWTTWSIFDGEERWRSEGIQIGGVQSARGVIGYWFDKDYDAHGPAGPTAFWKAHDRVEKPVTNPIPADGQLHAMHVPLY